MKCFLPLTDNQNKQGLALNKIKKLPDDQIIKIAAGEVVERPASVVKELVENSLDSGAKSITIKINQGGKSLIEITDDGCGMSQEQAEKSVLAHWTSKLEKVEDLDSLNSFGFRGEALASISSVSRLSMITRARDSQEAGVKLEFEFGKLVKQSQTASSSGTTISVTDLFENVPARKKFLKQNETEFNQIFGLVQQFALANKDVSFFVHKDGRMFLNAPKVDDLKSRVCQLWDYNLSESLVELSGQAPDIKISGLISDGSASRYSKSGIFLLVNGRPVKDQKVSNSILKGYQERLPAGRFPVCFVFIDVEGKTVDVNIHPRKEQVRFSAYGLVCSSIKEAVSASLEKNVDSQIKTEPDLFSFPQPSKDEFKPSQSLNQTIPEQNLPSFQAKQQLETNISPKTPDQDTKVFQDSWQEKTWQVERPTELTSSTDQAAAPASFVQQTTHTIEQPHEQVNFGKVIGQLMSTFILIEKPDGLVVVDQHAAHERIIYERMKASAHTIEGTRLLFPELITLDNLELAALLQHKQIFSKFGMELDKFSATQAALSSAPCSMPGKDTAQIIKESLKEILDFGQLDSQTVTKKISKVLHAQISCKAAVRAGDPMDNQSIEQLLTDLEKTPNRFQCIHGRPTIWKIEKSSLYKHFSRPFKKE